MRMEYRRVAYQRQALQQSDTGGMEEAFVKQPLQQLVDSINQLLRVLNQVVPGTANQDTLDFRTTVEMLHNYRLQLKVPNLRLFDASILFCKYKSKKLWLNLGQLKVVKGVNADI